jgi:hypothetical protein
VTAPRSKHGARMVVLHRVRRLDPVDVTVLEGIPVTTVARTLLDLAEVVSIRQLEHAYEDAERLRILDVRAVHDVLRRGHGRRGLRPLTAVVTRITGPPEPTRSELERRFLDLCREFAIPPPIVNALLHGFEVDALWPDQRLVVELDGRAFHVTRAAFERDRRRDTELQLAGYRVIRVTERRLAEEPAEVAADIRSLLGLPAVAPTQA